MIDDSLSSSSHIRRPGIRPVPSLRRRIDAFVRKTVPISFTLFVILILSVPISFPSKNELLPVIVIASVYFWSIFRPASMPAMGVFFLGFLIDLLNFTAPGIVIFILLIVHGIGVTQRFKLIKLNFLLIWLSFVFVAGGGIMLQWTLTSLFNLRVMPYQSVIFEVILALGFYPLLSMLFTWAHRTIADPEQA